MLRNTCVPIIVVLFIITHDSYVLSKKVNLTQILKGFYPRRYYHEDAYEGLVTRDTSYLPEEDYLDDLEAKDNDVESLERDNRNLMPEYHNLCEIVTKRVHLGDAEYEYQPPHYHEVYCKSYSTSGEEGVRPQRRSKQKCAHPGFQCVQRSRTMFMVRRRWDSECWELFTKEIPSGCDCMWPVSLLGDISAHF